MHEFTVPVPTTAEHVNKILSHEHPYKPLRQLTERVTDPPLETNSLSIQGYISGVLWCISTTEEREAKEETNQEQWHFAIER